jgi:hypothetical protein
VRELPQANARHEPAWGTGLDSTAGCYLELRFGEEIEIAGVRFLLTFPFTGYPGRLDVSVRRPDGKRRLQRFDRDRADRELLARLLASGHDAWYHVDFAPVVANGVRLVVAEADGDRNMAPRLVREHVAYNDQVFAWSERLSRKLFGREIPQILLIHDTLG